MTREYNLGNGFFSICPPDEAQQQIALCTNDERCQAAADEHDPGCPIEQQLQDELGF